MKRTILFIFIVLIILISCNFSKRNTNEVSIRYDTDYSNPIDDYYFSKINSSQAECDLRAWQDEYYNIWAEQFEKIIRLMQEKCTYQKDIDALEAYKTSIYLLLDNTSVILVTEWLDDYKLPPNCPERGSWGNGTRSGLNMKKAEILRNACMILIPYCDKYIYPNLK